MFTDPDDNEDILAFGDSGPRIPRRVKRLAAAGTVVAGAAVAVSLLALHGTSHAPAPARTATQPSAETVYEFQSNAQIQTTTTSTSRIYKHGHWATMAVPVGAAIPASAPPHIVKIDPATGRPACP